MQLNVLHLIVYCISTVTINVKLLIACNMIYQDNICYIHFILRFLDSRADGEQSSKIINSILILIHHFICECFVLIISK